MSEPIAESAENEGEGGSFAWSAGVVQIIRTLWLDGSSASQIAKALKKIGVEKTRNAVIGKLARLGLTRGTPQKRALRKENVAAHVGRVNRVRTGKPQLPPPTPRVLKINGEDDLRPLIVRANSFEAFRDIHSNACRFIYGDPTGTPFSICGREGFPFCEAHRRITYAPAQEKAA